MARYEIAPTKTNLMRVKRDLGFASEGYELLDQKRKILVVELMGLIDRAVEAQEEVEAKLKEAFDALDQSMLRMGRREVNLIALGMNIESRVSFSEKRVMGVSLPRVRVELEDRSPYFAAAESSIWIDETIRRFRDVLQLLGNLAEARISLMRLSREVAKTIRRVNALEKIFIPDYEETLGYIVTAIEESEREAFFVLKLIKDRLSGRKGEAQ
ncbi:MAG TPA: V-type ATP synthase subunit D [Candidatus Eisenbacteria bacterium]|uniref:V-type ATP synthase subunit D n=1 Tax=Eiseniibacteriota bacterium TaxID=2212470 RepID=A0A7V2F302_UNCEI|nr:V-type ATP synthase subunit D [Candidatus Eisenbacteria bacterium]